MKKIALFAVASLALGLGSCKKDHSCTCTDTGTNGQPDYTITYTLGKTKKKDAQKTCDDTKTTLQWDKCELK